MPGNSGFKLSFWPMQASGWLLYAIAIATLNLPLRHDKEVVAFRTAFLLSAFAASFLMYLLCRLLWRNGVDLFRSIAACIFACSVLGFVCSAVSAWSEIRFGGSTFQFRWASALSGTTGGAFVLIAWSAIYFGVKQYEALEEERRRLRVSEASARDAQLLALRYQLQPHFLFNTLNAISALVVGNHPELATQTISRLADLLRSTLDEPDVHFVSLAEELVVVKEYLSIEEVRFGSRLRVAFQTPPETLTINVPRFILQPLVENAIRHGISHLPAGGSIHFAAAKAGDNLELCIQNDVDDLQAIDKKSSGLGLANTRKRVEQIYGARGALNVSERRDKAFVVTIVIPMVATDRESRASQSVVGR